MDPNPNSNSEPAAAEPAAVAVAEEPTAGNTETQNGNQQEAEAEDEKRAADHAHKLFKWVINCMEDDNLFEFTSTVKDMAEVWKPLICVGTETEYRGVKINKLTSAQMVESVRGFFSYQRPGSANELEHKPGWVLFEHGTYVVIPEPDPVEDYKAEAIRLMQRWGPVLMGTPASDVAMAKVKSHIHNGIKGWIGFGQYPVFGTFVGENELEGMTHENENNMLIAVYGREKRHLDATELVIVHEERQVPNAQ